MSEPENVKQEKEIAEKLPPEHSESNLLTSPNVSVEITEDFDSAVKSFFPDKDPSDHETLVTSIASFVEKTAKKQVDNSTSFVIRRTQDVDRKRYAILDKLRINCVNLAAYHNNRYHLYKNMLFTCFRVPLIVLSGLNSFFSVGLQTYMEQRYISLINAVISLFCGILTSVELLLNLQKRMEMEMECGKEYYKLSVEIYTELSKAPEDRGENGDLGKYLTEKHNAYQTLHARGNAVNLSERGFIDEFELYLDTDVEISSNDGDSKGRSQRSGSYHAQSTLCPQCIVHMLHSCLTMVFYCCTSGERWGSEQSLDLQEKKKRENARKLITRGHPTTFRMSGDLNMV